MAHKGLLIETLKTDLRQGVRQCRRAPGFTALAVLVLAIGIGANLAVFALFDALVLRPLGVGDPNRLVAIAPTDPTHPLDGEPFPLAVVADIERAQVFTQVAGYASAGPTVEAAGVFSQVGVAFVTEHYFDVVQVPAALGRLITSDDVKTAAPVAVLTDEYWRRWYARDPAVLGSTVQLQGVPFTVVGVSARGYGGLIPEDPFAFTVPITTERRLMEAFGSPADEPIAVQYVLGRLAPGKTLGSARSQLQAVWPAIRAANAPAQTDERERFLRSEIDVKSASHGFSFLRDWWQRPLAVLIGATAAVLLVACVNLASLTVARTIRRRREIVVRAALGASRWRLVQQELMKSLLIAAAGTVLAVPLAYWAARTIAPFLWMWDTPNTSQIDLVLDPSLAGVLIGSMALTTIATGVWPAFRATGGTLQHTIQQAQASVSPISRWADRLLVGQIAAALVLLVAAGLFSKNLARLRSTDLGLAPGDVFIAGLLQQPRRDATIDPAPYSAALADRLLALQGVRSVAFASTGPLLGIEASEWRQPVAIAGSESGTNEIEATFLAVSPQYFRTMGIGLREGRDFLPTDDSHRRQVVILSASLARHLFGNERALGRRVRVVSEARLQDLQVVGISSDASLADIHSTTRQFVFLPLLQASSAEAQMPQSIVLRAAGSFNSLQPGIRKAVESLGQQYVTQQRSLDDQIDRSLIRDRLLAIGTNAFGILAAALVAIGLAGVMSAVVAARKREIGIRVALGASGPALRRMVLGHAGGLALRGVALGVTCSWIATRWIGSMLSGVSSDEPGIMLSVAVALIVIAVSAVWMAATRAARVDPVDALRSE